MDIEYTDEKINQIVSDYVQLRKDAVKVARVLAEINNENPNVIDWDEIQLDDVGTMYIEFHHSYCGDWVTDRFDIEPEYLSDPSVLEGMKKEVEQIREQKRIEEEKKKEREKKRLEEKQYLQYLKLHEKWKDRNPFQ